MLWLCLKTVLLNIDVSLKATIHKNSGDALVLEIKDNKLLCINEQLLQNSSSFAFDYIGSTYLEVIFTKKRYIFSKYILYLQKKI